MTQKKIGWSGQSIQIWDLAVGLRERGHEVFLVAQPGSAFSEKARAAGFPLFEFKMKGWAQLPTAVRLASLLRKHKIDLLHCHDARDHQIGCLAARLGGARALVRTKHNMLPLRNRFSRLVYGPLTSHLISVSDAVKEMLVSCGMPPEHVTTVYNFADTTKFMPKPADPKLKAALGIPDRARVVGTVGRLHISKGIAELIAAIPAVVKQCDDARFLLVGGRQEQWEPLAEELGIRDRIVFTGSVSNVTDYLALMDVAVFPTYREAFGLAILEAMATRRAVAASRVGAVPEIIEHETHGLLFEPRSAESMAQAVIRLLEDAELRARVATAAFEKASVTFTRDRCLSGTEKAYELALKN
ncbi:MAG: glycosyltransferase family 4 protein [Planctomycetota bacterium]